MTSEMINDWFWVLMAISLGTISGLLSERVGIVNIGINGMMTFGAMLFSIFSIVLDKSSPWMFLLAIPLSALISVLIGGLFALATVKLGANHIISGTGINLLANGIGMLIVSFSNRIFSGHDVSSGLPNKFNKNLIDIVNTDINGETIIFLILVILMIIGIYIFLNFTKMGLRYRACGENPNAVDAQGVNVLKYQWLGLLFVGFLAGFGGACYAYKSTSFTGDVDGLGFVALAIMIVSSWKVLPSFIVSTVFALLFTYTTSAYGSGIQGYSLRILPYALTLVAMIAFSKYVKGPKNAGNTFNKSLR